MKKEIREFNYPISVIVIFGLIMTTVLLTTYFYYNSEIDTIKKEKQNILKGVAELKKEQIVKWRNERIADGTFAMKSSLIANNIRNFISEKNTTNIKQIDEWVNSYFVNHNDYKTILFIDHKGNEIFSRGRESSNFLNGNVLQLLEKSRIEKKLLLSEPYLVNEIEISMDMIIPIMNPDFDSTVLGTLIFKIAPEIYLFPLIQNFPIPSRSAEIILIKKDGNSVLFLNELRFKGQTALKLRIPLQNKRIPAVQAALGKAGLVEGIDYRGEEVIAYTDPIPDTDWKLLTKVDKAEIYAAIKEKRITITLFLLLLLGASFSIYFYILRSSKTRFYQHKYQAEKDKQELNLKQLEYLKALNEAETKYKYLVESLPAITYTASAVNFGASKYVSPQVKEILGYTQEEFSSLKDFFLGIIHPLDRERILEAYKKLQNEGYAHSEYRVIKKSGEIIWADDTAVIVQLKDSNEKFIQGVFVDITAKKAEQEESRKKTEALFESEKRFRELADMLPQTVFETDLNGNLTYTNHAALDLFSYYQNEYRGMNILSLVTPGDFDKAVADFKSIISGQKPFVKNEYRVKRKDGSEFPGFIYCNTVFKDDKINGIRGILVDITDQKEISKQLISAKEQAEEMSRLKTSFLSNMSHELRTPMIGILGYTELLIAELTNTEHINMAEVVHSSGTRLLDSLNLILDLSKIEANKKEVYPKTLSASEIMHDTILTFQKIAAKRNLELIMENPEGEMKFVSDERMVITIMNNLINNSLKFTAKGSIKVGCKQIVLDDLEYIQFSVKDTGIGISEQSQKIIFQVFRQGSEGYSRGFEGFGLGLTVSKKFVEMLGGRIWVESELNKGATFIFIIPVVPIKAEIKKEIPSTIPVEKTVDKKISKMDILVVDDDQLSRNVVQILLKDLAMVDVTEDGPGALKKAHSMKYDLILLDIGLKGNMDGIEVLSQLRKIQGYQSTPIIAFTAYALKNEVQSFMAAGFDNYLTKPFSKEELLKVIYSAVR